MELPPTSSKGWVRSVLHRAKAKTHGKWQSSGREMANGEQQQQKQNGIITMFTRRCSIHHWTDVGDTVLRVEKMGAAGILKRHATDAELVLRHAHLYNTHTHAGRGNLFDRFQKKIKILRW